MACDRLSTGTSGSERASTRCWSEARASTVRSLVTSRRPVPVTPYSVESSSLWRTYSGWATKALKPSPFRPQFDPSWSEGWMRTEKSD